MANINWRTINIDALDPDSPANFDLSSLAPAVEPVSTADVQNNAQQIRQLLRGGDNEGALQAALEKPPYGADDKGKVRCASSIAPETWRPKPLNRELHVFPDMDDSGHRHNRVSGLGLSTTRLATLHNTPSQPKTTS
jgi:hypothetical protein